MRIGMAQGALGQQLAVGDQLLDHRAIGVAVLAFRRQDALAGKHRHMRGIGAVRLHQAEGVGILGRIVAVQPQHQLEIVLAMAGRVVDKAGAGIGGDESGRQHRHIEAIAHAAQGMRRHQ